MWKIILDECVFRKGRSMIEQLSVIGQIIEKNTNTGKIFGSYLLTTKNL